MHVSRSLVQAIDFGRVADQYRRLRAAHPRARALTIKRYINDDQGLSFEEYECSVERGHTWSYSGTQYGGDDESYGGEGRVYCCHCGADGDA